MPSFNYWDHFFPSVPNPSNDENVEAIAKQNEAYKKLYAEYQKLLDDFVLLQQKYDKLKTETKDVIL